MHGAAWRVFFLGLAAAAAMAMLSCGREPPARGGGTGPVRVVVTIPPLEGLVKPLLPGGAQVTTLIARGRSEHGYELTAQDVGALDAADMVVYVGLGLERPVEARLRANPRAGRQEVSFASAVGISGEPGHAEEKHEGRAGEPVDHDEDEHEHGGVDPHLWLDPDLVLKFIPALRAGVEKAIRARAGDPAGLTEREQKLAADVRALDEECKAKLAPLAGQVIVTHHAAWGRFAGHYGLKIAAVIRPFETSEPTKSAVDAAVKAVREQGARAIFVEPQFSPDVAARIARETGAKLGRLDPLGNGDWFVMMRGNADSLVQSLGR